MQQTKGRCLCGGVTVTFSAPVSNVGVCHCEMCRRWCSGPWMALQVPGSVISGDTLEVYKSSPFAERGFCRRCGACIYHRPQDGPELAVSAGLFDSTDFEITSEIFIDRKPPFYRFDSDGEKVTEASMIRRWVPRLLWRRIKRWFSLTSKR